MHDTGVSSDEVLRKVTQSRSERCLGQPRGGHGREELAGERGHPDDVSRLKLELLTAAATVLGDVDDIVQGVSLLGLGVIVGELVEVLLQRGRYRG
jgi:hypothetical protein